MPRDEGGRLRRITERQEEETEEEEQEGEQEEEEKEEEEQEEERVEEERRMKHGADFTSVKVEAWTSFNKLHTVNNLACIAWAQVNKIS